jgi:hypothetical protein
MHSREINNRAVSVILVLKLLKLNAFFAENFNEVYKSVIQVTDCSTPDIG